MTKIDDLARSLAERPPPGRIPDGIRAEARDLPFERIARVLATPM